jgi:hypothetical protein
MTLPRRHDDKAAEMSVCWRMVSWRQMETALGMTEPSTFIARVRFDEAGRYRLAARLTSVAVLTAALLIVAESRASLRGGSWKHDALEVARNSTQ